MRKQKKDSVNYSSHYFFSFKANEALSNKKKGTSKKERQNYCAESFRKKFIPKTKICN